ncbi:MAG: hypothetical protein ABI743_12790, partial [bacterium]
MTAPMHPHAAMVDRPWPRATYEDWLVRLARLSAADRERLVIQATELTDPADRASARALALALGLRGETAPALAAVDALIGTVADDVVELLELNLVRARIGLATQEAAATETALDDLAAAEALVEIARLGGRRAPIYGWRGVGDRTLGRFADMMASFRAGIAAITPETDPIDAAILWNNFGLAQLEFGLDEAAAEALQQALAIFKPLGATRYL